MSTINELTVEREYDSSIELYTKKLGEFKSAIETASKTISIFESARDLYESLLSYKIFMSKNLTKSEKDIEKIKSVSDLCILAKNLIEADANNLESRQKEFLEHLNNKIVAHISLNTFFKGVFRTIALSALPLAIAAGLIAVCIILNVSPGLCFLNSFIAGISGTIGLLILCGGIHKSVKEGFGLEVNRSILHKKANTYLFLFSNPADEGQPKLYSESGLSELNSATRYY